MATIKGGSWWLTLLKAIGLPIVEELAKMGVRKIVHGKGLNVQTKKELFSTLRKDVGITLTDKAKKELSEEIARDVKENRDVVVSPNGKNVIGAEKKGGIIGILLSIFAPFLIEWVAKKIMEKHKVGGGIVGGAFVAQQKDMKGKKLMMKKDMSVGFDVLMEKMADKGVKVHQDMRKKLKREFLNRITGSKPIQLDGMVKVQGAGLKKTPAGVMYLSR